MLRSVQKFINEIKPLHCSIRLSSTSPSDDRYPGYDKKTIYGEEYPIWHKPLTERPDEFRSKFSLLGFDKIDFTRLKIYDETLSWYQILQNWFKTHLDKMDIEDQQFVMARYELLRADLAAAHFVCYRGGSVKFLNEDKWIKKVEGKHGAEVEIPNVYVPGLFLQAIDFEHFRNGKIRYEGLNNLQDLPYLSWLSFRNCSSFDDWHMDRLSNIVHESLEYLDIRGSGATYRGLNALYRYHKLKVLLVDFSNLKIEEEIVSAEQTLAMLQEYFDGLLIKTH